VQATAAGAQTDDQTTTTTTAPGEPTQTTDPEDATTVRGRLVNQTDDETQEPVEGVDITVSQDGDEIETVTSDGDGEWEVVVPGPGQYVVELDADSLPKDVELREEGASTTRTVSISTPGQSRTAVFPLGEDPRQTVSRFDEVMQKIFDGLRFGLIIAMAAVGLSLIFGTTGLTNFAHGEIVTGGALIAWFLNSTIGMPLLVAAPLAMLLTGIAGGALEKGLWRPLRKRRTGLIAMLVVSIGLALGVRYVYQYIFGGRTRPYTDYNLQIEDRYGPIGATPKELWSIIIAIVVLVAVAVLLQRTRLGKAMRAVADNPELASASGIDVDRIILLVWIFGSGLACLGGVLLGLAEQVSWEMGARLLLLMFAGITLGGLGTAYGALLGCFLVGLLSSLSTLYIDSSLRTVPALVLLAVILLIRPQGILGRRERVG
jgi:branched-chain amino acid transport system permease protein